VIVSLPAPRQHGREEGQHVGVGRDLRVRRLARPVPGADIVLVIPALIGLFWGAPLAARELETGAFRLAWTQSVTRGRWLAVKLALVGLCSVAVAGLLSLMVTWWSSPLDRTYASQFIAFSERGIAPIGYAAFGFVLGVTVGLLIRRTVPAMAATVIPYIGARAAVTALRPHFMTAVTAAQKLPRDVNTKQLGVDSWPTYQSGNWVLASKTVTTGGQPAAASADGPRPVLPRARINRDHGSDGTVHTASRQLLL
jgi:hypothetical protein